MDAVITYVDGLDPVWQKAYAEAVNLPAMTKRFRDWGTLKYLLRGIQTNMPFIRKVFLVVYGKTQVPSWADTSNLEIVRHEDIIPEDFLPTFNSTAIEMFLHRIKDLDEEFLYFNDDVFPVSECRAEDFIKDGRIATHFSPCYFAGSMYRLQTRNSDRLARKALGLRPSLRFVRPQHTCSPMLRSASETVFSKVGPELLSRITMLRSNENCNQYVFLDYLYYCGKSFPGRISNKHFSLAVGRIDKICEFILNPSRKLVCINDVNLCERKYRLYREKLLEAFEKRFPEKSRFEK